MLHHTALVRHPDHDLLEAFRAQDELPVLLAEGQVSRCLQRLAFHIISAAASELLHSSSLSTQLLAVSAVALEICSSSTDFITQHGTSRK